MEASNNDTQYTYQDTQSTDQRTREWYLSRKGKITASECVALMLNGKRDMTPEELASYKLANPKSTAKKTDVPFSDATYTYLNEKVAERLMTDNAFIESVEGNGFLAKSLQWGIDHEEEAIARYSFDTSCAVSSVSFVPLKGYKDLAGGSPDGLVIDMYRQTNGIIEVKCPYTSTVHIDYFLCNTVEELRDSTTYGEKYYAQMQFNMMVTNTDWCDFVSYDPRLKRDKQLKVLRVYKDEQWCKEMLVRLDMAQKYMDERMEKIMGCESVVVGENCQYS